jgi:zinc/manganese transport system permease protein
VNPRLSLDPLSDLHQLVAFPFMVNALEAGSAVAVMASVAGWFMVLRRQSFAGHTLAIMSFPGASGAALAGLPLASGYFAVCVVAAVAIASGSRVRGSRDPAQESSVVGTVQVTAFALGFLFLSLYSGVLEDLESLLFGSFLGVTRSEVEALVGVCLATVAFFALVGRPLLYSSLDDKVARARGVPVPLLDVAFLIVLGLAVAATAQITGVLLVFALLVAPAAAAQQLTSRIGIGLCLTVVIGLAVTWVGLGLAYFTNDSVGFFVTSIAFGAYLLASVGRRLRQVVAAGRVRAALGSAR